MFEARFCNDETGAPVYDAAILLKIILYAYVRGITQSHEIARLCRENVLFVELSADTAPHFTSDFGVEQVANWSASADLREAPRS